MKIQLLEATDEYRAAILAGSDSLAKKTNLLVPANWPVFPEIFRRPANSEWPLFFFIDHDRSAIVGSGGFLSDPDDHGRVQIGYEVAPEYRGMGIATLAMKQVLSLRPSAHVVAITEEISGASVSVLCKLGLVQAGTIQPPGSTHMYLWASQASAA